MIEFTLNHIPCTAEQEITLAEFLNFIPPNLLDPPELSGLHPEFCLPSEDRKIQKIQPVQDESFPAFLQLAKKNTEGEQLPSSLSTPANSDGSLPPLIALVNSVACDLNTTIHDQDHIVLLDYTSRLGFMAYQRTALLILLDCARKLFHNLSLIVEFALGDGLFLRRTDLKPLSPEMIAQLEDEMHHVIQAGYPIRKEMHLPDPVHVQNRFLPGTYLLPYYFVEDIPAPVSYRREEKSPEFRISADPACDHSHIHFAGRSSILNCGWEKPGSFSSFTADHSGSSSHESDCFYIPLLTSTDQIRYFSLQSYQDGMLLRIPVRSTPDILPPFADTSTSKLFETLRQTSRWANRLGIRRAAELNQAIVDGRSNDLILISEALQEKRIAQMAETVTSSKDIKIVLIAGPSSSGKTSFANRLSIQMQANGAKPLMISVDNYFVDREKSPRNPDGSYNFDTLDAIDLQALAADMQDLLDHKPVQLPVYNFIEGKRTRPDTPPARLDENGVIVLEGIFCLNDKLIAALPTHKAYKIYVSALGQINLDNHNYIRSTDGRLLRRIVRDHRTRGVSALKTISSWQSVRNGEEKNIFPYQNNADAMFNTSALYEWAVLKKYAQPLLHQIGMEEEAYPEARRLLALLDHFLSIDNDLIPKNSLIREFIGGSCFNV